MSNPAPMPTRANNPIDPQSYTELAGKRVLITGASRPLGAAIARAFAPWECRMVLQFDGGPNDGFGLADDIARTCGGLRALKCDFDDDASIGRFARTAVGGFGGIDIVINAADMIADGPAPQTSEDDLDAAVAAHLRAPFYVSRIAAERMRLAGTGGVIVNVANIDQAETRENIALYAMTRVALEQMTRAQADEWSDDGIRVNAIATGVPIDALAHDTKTMYDRSTQSCLAARHGAVDRCGTIEEMAASTLILATARGERMAGTTLTVDGRWTVAL